MDTLILEDFRCFAGRNEVPIRPLTLLVGENSTGKTSFLAAVRAAHDRAAPDFNEPPFHLGSYDEIANHGADPATGFMVGHQFTIEEPTFLEPILRRVRVEVHFSSLEAQPTISDLSVVSGQYKLAVGSLDRGQPEVSFSAGDLVLVERSIDERLVTSMGRTSARLWPALSAALHLAYGRGNDEALQVHEFEFNSLLEWALLEIGPRPYAFAPIRTHPRRTYDRATRAPDPEGRHIPIVLAVSTDALPDFRERIEEFGKASGLYSNLSVRKLGPRGSDPFQVEVELPGEGGARNLIDVGYGVSQAIPIIVDCVSAPSGSTLLIQQPEVHLHPRAQAAMGSFLGQLAATGRNDVIVETHSDYLLDRVLVDVRDEKIPSQDVLILYFERAGDSVEIHPIEVDAAGRIVDVPEGYRSFFLDEQRRFFGVD